MGRFAAAPPAQLQQMQQSVGDPAQRGRSPGSPASTISSASAGMLEQQDPVLPRRPAPCSSRLAADQPTCGNRDGINGTPNFLINGKLVTGRVGLGDARAGC